MVDDSQERVRSQAFRAKVMTPEDASTFIKDGMTVSMSGFTAIGYPKAVPKALASRVRQSGERLKLFLITGASVGDEIDGEFARLGMISRRTPYQTNADLRRQTNAGACDFFDIHLGEIDAQVRRGFHGRVDVAVVEATLITPDGKIVPTTAVGNAPSALATASQVIIEVNQTIPEEMFGLHDVFMPGDPPNRRAIPVFSANQRVGVPYMEVDPDKVCAVVMSDFGDASRPLAEQDDVSRAISANLIDFLSFEVKQGRLPANLLPLQSGVGNISNSVLQGFVDSSFHNLSMYSEVIQDGALDLIDAGKVVSASSTALTLSPQRTAMVLRNIDKYRDKIVLRPQEITNSAEVISRLGVIAINAAVEVDLYGNVNSTHVSGRDLLSGLGGSGDFARNGYLSIFCAPAMRNNGRISGVVPHVSHIDHTEHDVDVLVTEQGVADLRSLSPRERAARVIARCAHPLFRPALKEYWDICSSRGGHCPVDLSRAFGWHINLDTSKSMVTMIAGEPESR